ncbi:hypothetical protein M3223_22260 [Paenibacillus pasadenensis]|uniref:hypothetical protein n=1 Tax=Paenibacillus pasadenensis TaxID=217090 RepID=UPI00204237F3|nr:hypothetical protein [Paenibacillus pasadenensis]MCM3750063.1 hypothetical protein [Paenibacillus pasadenensis]
MWKANSGFSRFSESVDVKGDKGSSLLLVVFLILLLSLLGVAVLGASLGGALRTERSEENVQSLHLAQKGLDEAVAAIYDRFNNRSIDPESLGDELKNFTIRFNEQLNRDMNTGSSGLDAASRPFYQVVSVLCADEGECGSPVGTGSGAYQFALIVTAEAQVDGALRRLQQEIVLDTYPDFLKYAFGSEGMVTVHGAPYFRGNLYAGEGLLLSDTAEYVYLGKLRTQKTQFMYLDPYAGTGSAAQEGSGLLITGDGSNMLYGNGTTYPDDASGYTAVYDRSLAAASGIDADRTHGLGSRIRVEPPQKFVSIDVRSSFLDKVRDSMGALAGKNERTIVESVYSAEGAAGLVAKLKNQYGASYEQLGSPPALTVEEPVLPDILLNTPLPEENAGDGTVPPSSPSEYELAKFNYERELQAYEEAKAVYNLAVADFGVNLRSIGAAGRKGSALVDGPLILNGDLPAIDFAVKGKHNWLIVNGDLELYGAPIGAKPADGEEEQDTRAAGPVKLRGNILVTGNVTLSGQVDVDATMYVLGRTDIRDAALRGLRAEGSAVRKEIVLIGSGPIDMYRVDSFQRVESGYGTGTAADSPVLDAFLYTDSSANLYGVGSAFWMRGGFFSRGNLTLNATMGTTTELEPTSQQGARLGFEDQGSIDKEKARFIIEFNNSVFGSQNVALPRVNRVRLTTGPLKLVD